MQNDEVSWFEELKEKKECNYSPHDGLAEAFHRDIRCWVIAARDATIVIVIS